MKAFKFAGDEFDKVFIVLGTVEYSKLRFTFIAGLESVSRVLMGKLVISRHPVVAENDVPFNSRSA